MGMNSSYLTPEHIADLDKIGMVWDVYDFVFERNYHAAVEYYREHGDLNCRTDYVDKQGNEPNAKYVTIWKSGAYGSSVYVEE